MVIKVTTYLLLMVSIFGAIMFIFWQQEYQYAQPTPVPANIKEVALGQKVDLTQFGLGSEKPKLLHFFNFDCPCSRFNIKDFQSMVRKYQDSVDFIAVISAPEVNKADVERFKKKYDLGIKTLADSGHKLSGYLGIYSTPQAVIIDGTGSIYYRGNYNKSRYCVSRNTQFAEIALGALTRGEALPLLPRLASIPYGCSIVEEQNSKLAFGFF